MRQLASILACCGDDALKAHILAVSISLADTPAVGGWHMDHGRIHCGSVAGSNSTLKQRAERLKGAPRLKLSIITVRPLMRPRSWSPCIIIRV